MASTKCRHPNDPPNAASQSKSTGSPGSPLHRPLQPQDDCATDVEEIFDTQKFLAEIRSLTPSERERLIRSYAR